MGGALRYVNCPVAWRAEPDHGKEPIISAPMMPSQCPLWRRPETVRAECRLEEVATRHGSADGAMGVASLRMGLLIPAIRYPARQLDSFHMAHSRASPVPWL
jgi:hypothetical protein